MITTHKPLSTTLFCLISEGHLLELHGAITHYLHYHFFYQLSYIKFYNKHTNYSCYLNKKNDTLNRML